MLARSSCSCVVSNRYQAERVTGVISVNLKDVTVIESLEAIREVYGYEYRIDGNRIYIQPATLQTRLFQVNYLVGVRSGSSSMSVNSGVAAAAAERAGMAANVQAAPTGHGEATVVSMRTQGDFWTELTSSLRQMVGTAEGRNVILNPQSGVVVVRAMPDELRAVEGYLKAMRLSVERQVMLEARIVEVTLAEGSQSGVNWAALGAARNILGMGQSTAQVGLAGSVSTSAGNGPPGLAFQIRDFSSLLSFLETQGAIQVLSSPRIATINNQKAVLKVGLDQSYVSQVRAMPLLNPVTGTQAGVSFSPILSPYFSGVSLDITPQINEDGNILLHIHPLVSRVDNGPLSFNPGNGLGQQNLTIAKTTINEADTILRVPDGNIVALGGLMHISLEGGKPDSPPGQSDAGGAGPPGPRTRSAVKKELVILIKPTVVQSRNWEQGFGAAAEAEQAK